MEHGFIHGAEAEELRSGIENIVGDMHSDQQCSDLSGEDARDSLRDARTKLIELLDNVDARDSLAFREAQRS